MWQTLTSPALSIAAPSVSPRLAKFGVALIAAIVVGCFAVLIAARDGHRPAGPAPVADVAAR